MLPSKRQKNSLPHFWKLCLLSVIWTLHAIDSHANQAQTNLPRTQLQAGMFIMDVQVARTPLQRQVGLMFRRSLNENEGMLFIFDEPQIQCFWMKNTFIPLTAAFIDDQGTITQTVDMTPQSTQSHCSKQAVRYVLEMPQGWFKKKKIPQGFRIKGL